MPEELGGHTIYVPNASKLVTKSDNSLGDQTHRHAIQSDFTHILFETTDCYTLSIHPVTRPYILANCVLAYRPVSVNWNWCTGMVKVEY